MRSEPRHAVAGLAGERRASEPVAHQQVFDLQDERDSDTREAPTDNRRSRWAYVFRAWSIAFATVLSLTPSVRAIALSLIPSSRRCLALSASFR